MKVKRKWLYKGPKEGVKDLIGDILKNRGIKDREKFLNPSLDHMHSMDGFPDSKKAIQMIKDAIDSKKTIVIYHDYDADGIGGGSAAYLMLKELGAVVYAYSNDRFKQGYGMCHSGIDDILNEHGKKVLIITVDNGISQIESSKYAKDMGLDLIITDHHEPQDEIPVADAIINPKYNNSYPFDSLCGAGVIWKLLSELYPNKQYDTEKYLDIIALSTVADVVPLIDENRIIVAKGIPMIQEGIRPTFNILNELTETTEISSHFTLAYLYGPIVNAVGRLNGDVSMAIKAFTSSSKKEITEILEEMIEINERRKEMTTEQLESVRESFEDSNVPSCIVLQRDGLHEGIVGLVAGRIKEEFNRPVIIFSGPNDDGVCKGSARSIEGLDMMDALKDSNELLEGFGGHAPAAGMSIKLENIDEFRKSMIAYSDKTLTEEDFIRKYDFFAQLTPNNITNKLIEDLKSLEPFGKDFEKPLFKLVDFKYSKVLAMGEEKTHLKLTGQDLSVIGWRQVETFDERVGGKKEIVALGYPEVNNFKGKQLMQFIINEDNFY